MFFWFDWLYIVLGLIVLPGIIFGVWAQNRVHNVYLKANKMFSAKGIPTQDMARRVLDAADLRDVQIQQVPGELTDHYNTKTRTIAISAKNWNNTSVAALGIVAHEIGHAMQHKEKYKPMKFQQVFGNVANLFNRWLWIFIIVSVLADVLLWTGGYSNNMYVLYFFLGTYGLITLTTLFTLPVEFNASNRTRKILVETGLLNDEEYSEVKNVLNAAALTYVAAAVISLLQFIRILVWILSITRNRR